MSHSHSRFFFAIGRAMAWKRKEKQFQNIKNFVKLTHLPILAGIPLGSDLIFSRTLSTTIRDKASNSGLDSRLKYKKKLYYVKKAEITLKIVEKKLLKDRCIYLSPQPDDLLSKFCSSRLTVKCWLIFSPVSAKQKVYYFCEITPQISCFLVKYNK